MVTYVRINVLNWIKIIKNCLNAANSGGALFRERRDKEGEQLGCLIRSLPFDTAAVWMVNGEHIISQECNNQKKVTHYLICSEREQHLFEFLTRE